MSQDRICRFCGASVALPCNRQALADQCAPEGRQTVAELVAARPSHQHAVAGVQDLLDLLERDAS